MSCEFVILCVCKEAFPANLETGSQCFLLVPKVSKRPIPEAEISLEVVVRHHKRHGPTAMRTSYSAWRPDPAEPGHPGLVGSHRGNRLREVPGARHILYHLILTADLQCNT